jgi:hypothetical protein
MNMIGLTPMIFLCVGLLALFGIIWTFGRLRRSGQIAANHIAALEAEIAAVNGAAIGVGQRLIAVEKKLKLSIEHQQQKVDDSHVGIQPYDQATTLAEQGADIQQLVDQCGLPEAEASLLSLLQASARQVSVK